MARPAKTLRINNGKLWPSVVYAGATVIRFLKGRKGKQVKIIQRDGRRPRHIRLQQ